MRTTSRKERDVKFIIYQSLYIFVIATLGYHGINLSDITRIQPTPSDPGNVVSIPKAELDSLKSQLAYWIKNGVIISEADTVINRDSLNALIEKARFDPRESDRLRAEVARLRSQTSQLNSEVSRLRTALQNCLRGR